MIWPHTRSQKINSKIYKFVREIGKRVKQNGQIDMINMQQPVDFLQQVENMEYFPLKQQQEKHYIKLKDFFLKHNTDTKFQKRVVIEKMFSANMRQYERQ